METLSDTNWDVIINGTGFSQSLLALWVILSENGRELEHSHSLRALSRSGKKVLHVDSNQYYGGPDAAFSLDEAQEWVKEVNQGGLSLPSRRFAYS